MKSESRLHIPSRAFVCFLLLSIIRQQFLNLLYNTLTDLTKEVCYIKELESGIGVAENRGTT